MSDIIFANALLVKEGKYGTKVGIKVDDFTAFMMEHRDEKGWVNIEIKESQSGKLYAKLDTWKPDAAKPSEEKHGILPTVSPADPEDDDLPF